jgi:hypothetical protein
MASAEERPPFCADCLTGFSWSGKPSGQEKKLGQFNTVYIASSGETKGQPAILMFTDVFGFSVHSVLLRSLTRPVADNVLQLQNPKILADQIHEATGWAVYVPDLFNGIPPSPHTFLLCI